MIFQLKSESVKFYFFFEILKKIAGMTKTSLQKTIHDVLENGLTDFSPIWHTSCVVQILQVSS